MARIPRFQSQRLASQLVGLPRQDRSGEIISQAVADAANTFVNIQKKQIAADKSTLASSLSSDFDLQVDQAQRNFQDKFRDDPFGHEDELEKEIKLIGNKVFGNAKYQEVRNLGSRLTDNAVTRSLVSARDWSTRRMPEVLQERSEVQAVQINNSMREGASLDSLSDGFKRIEETVASNIGSFSDSVLENQEMTMKSNAILETVNGMLLQGRFDEAIDVTKNEEFIDILGTKGVKKAEKTIATYKEQQASLAKKAQNLKIKDPYNYMREIVGDTDGFEPLNFTGDIANSFVKRQLYRDEMKERYGVNLRLMAPEEKKQVLSFLERESIASQTQALNLFSSSLTDEQMQELSLELFDEQPAIAGALTLFDENPEVATRILRGNALLKNKAISIPAVTSLRRDFLEKVSGTIESPQLINQVFEAVKANYAALAFDRKIFNIDETESNKLLDDSIAEVLGPIFEYNNIRIFSFRDKSGKFIEEETFGQIVDDTDSSDIEKAQGDIPRKINGEALNMDSFKKHGSFVTAGNGMYLMEINGDIALDKRGNPFEINFNKLKPVIDRKFKAVKTGRGTRRTLTDEFRQEPLQRIQVDSQLRGGR